MSVPSPSSVLDSLRSLYPYPHGLILSKSERDPFAPGLSGAFPTVAGAVDDLLSSPQLDYHAKAGDTLVFTFERKFDRSKFIRSIGHLKAAGYRQVAA